jgi:hypothetical protein
MEAALHSNTCGCRLIAAPGFLTCAGGRMASALGSRINLLREKTSHN